MFLKGIHLWWASHMHLLWCGSESQPSDPGEEIFFFGVAEVFEICLGKELTLHATMQE